MTIKKNMMKKLLKLTKYVSVLILAIFITTCDDDDDNLPEVIAGFTYTINIDTGTVTFINTSENSRTYIWDFGDGTTSTQINPIKTYENGTYTIVLEAINPAGASNTFEDEITILIPEIATLPISFDGENTSYDAETFGGASFEVVDNPDPSGTNTSTSKVGAVTNIGAAFEGFYFDLGAPIDLSTLGSVSMNFWADSPVDVLMKLEEGTAAPIETTASHGGTGWETIIFSFDSTDSYSRLTMFVDGPGTTAGTFYLDDITQVETPPDPCTEETEESLAAADFNLTFLSDPSASIVEDGADFTWIDNPDFENEVNKSCKVGQITKLGNNPWDNNQIDLDAKLDFNNNTGLKIKVWSAIDNTEVRIKLEEIGNPGNFSEQFTTTSITSAWEELEIPFTSADSDRFDKIVIFFDLNAGNTDTYYFDDLALYGTGSGGGGGGSFDSGLLTNGDFETGVAAPDWYGNAANVVDQGGNFVNEANVMTPVNPFDVNLSQAVALEADKTYELSFVAYTDDTTGSRSIITGIGEAADNFDAVTETPVLTSTPQTFTYQLTVNYNDFANSRVLFDMGAETGFVFIDDVSLFCIDCDSGGGGGTGDNIATNGDFETGDDTGWILFQNGGSAALDNSINNGGSWSGRLETNGPSNPAFKQEAIAAGTVAAGDEVQVQFDHTGTVGGEGGVFNVILFGEGAGGASFTHVFNPGPSLSGSWTTFTGTYTIPGGTDVSGGISFLIETVCGGASGCTVTANIDNVSVILNPQ